MNILEKLKSIFKKKENKEIKEIEKALDDSINNFNDLAPRGEVIGICALCGLEYGNEDKIKDFNNNKAHKRCVKKATKAILNGNSLEKIFMKGGKDGV